MSGMHNHALKCCCPVARGEAMPTGRERPSEHWNARLIREEAEVRAASACPACPEHGRANCVTTVDGWCRTCSTAAGPVYHRKDAPVATPYTEQETTNG